MSLIWGHVPILPKLGLNTRHSIGKSTQIRCPSLKKICGKQFHHWALLQLPWSLRRALQTGYLLLFACKLCGQAVQVLNYGSAKTDKTSDCATPDYQPAKVFAHHCLYYIFDLPWCEFTKSLVNYLFHLSY